MDGLVLKLTQELLLGSGLESTDMVTVMDRPITESPLKPEFDAFLFAPIGNNSNGMQVSVLSGLAQSELDPWQQAAELAQLPGKTAIDRLALLIGKMPDKGWAHPDAVAVATRLIALLPKQFSASRELSAQSLGAMMKSKPWRVCVVLMSFVLGFQFLIASRQLAPKADNDGGKASEIDSPAFSQDEMITRIHP